MTCKKEKDCLHGNGCFLKDDWDIARCSAFKRKPKKQTNEEWLKSMSTDELAEWIADQGNDLIENVLSDDDEYWVRKTDIAEWLKEMHEVEK